MTDEEKQGYIAASMQAIGNLIEQVLEVAPEVTNFQLGPKDNSKTITIEITRHDKAKGVS